MAYLDLINAVVDGDQIVKVKVRNEKAHWSELMFGARSRYFLELEMRISPYTLTIEYDWPHDRNDAYKLVAHYLVSKNGTFQQVFQDVSERSKKTSEKSIDI